MKTILYSLILLFTLSCTNNNDFEPQTITPVLIGKNDLYGNGEEGILQKGLLFLIKQPGLK